LDQCELAMQGKERHKDQNLNQIIYTDTIKTQNHLNAPAQSIPLKSSLIGSESMRLPDHPGDNKTINFMSVKLTPCFTGSCPANTESPLQT